MSDLPNRWPCLRRSVSKFVESVGGIFRKPRCESRRSGRSRLALAHVERLEDRTLLAGMQVGMNLSDLADWDPAWVFKDVFKSSREWTSHGYNTVTRQIEWAGGANVPVEVNEQGWPTRLTTWTNSQGQLIEQRLGTLMFRELDGRYPAGIYTAEWDGTGTVSFGFDARAVETGRTASGRNFARLQVTPGNGGIYLRIDATNPADPIRNINVWMPDYNGQSFVGHTWRPGDDGTPFHPLFLERLQPFDTIRAIHPNDTIESDIVRWSDRREVGDARQSTALNPFRNGWAPEYQIELCNELDANCYFNMPHMADDDYVRNFATLVRDTLEPGLTAYVEWSNEVWNFAPGFEATFWVRDQTLLPENAGLSHWQIVAREAKRDLDIWAEVFSGDRDRLVRVVGGFAAVPWITNQVALNMGDAFDAIAIAPYIGPSGETRATYTAATTPDQILDDTAASISFMVGRTTEHQQMADRYAAQFGHGVRLITYEAGMHLDGRNQPYQQAMYDAGLLPRSYGIYRDYMDAMANAGVDLLMHFNFTGRARATQWGDFAALHFMDEPVTTAIKYRALTDYINEHAGDIEPPPPTPTITLTATDAVAAEASRDPATFTITRAGAPLDEPLTVNYSVTGTATNGTDFDSLSGRVTIPAGQASATVSVTPIDDLFVENSETVILTLLDADSYDLGSSSSATATLTSDDVAPTLPVVGIFASDSFASETNRNVAVFTVRRTNHGLNLPLTVSYSVTGTASNGSDFNLLSGSVTIPAGAAGTSIVVTPIDDTEVEDVETIVLTLQASPTYRLGTAASQTATARLASNDRPAPVRPTVTVAATDAAAAEAGRDPGTVTFTRAGGSTSAALAVNYTVTGTASNGHDFASLSGRVTIPAGQASATVTVTPVDDTVVDPNETVVLTIAANAAYVVGTASSATVTIADNDSPAQQVLPALLVISNRDFYFQEYADTRTELERAGITVVVAAAERTVATPHANSGQGNTPGTVLPDVALRNARATDYSTIVFVGGWGSSAYQFGFSGTYTNSAYNGSLDTERAVNSLISDFVRQDKYVAAICHGVTVLAWARIDTNGNGTIDAGDRSPIAGRSVVAYAGSAPASSVAGSTSTRWHIESNGATMLPSRSVGNTATDADDVLVDGRFITAENWNSARQFGQVIALRLGS